MYHSEVEEWLYSIGLPHLYNYFIEDGFTTLDSIRHMRQSDIDTIVDRNGYMIILNEEIDRLNYGDSFNNYSNNYAPAERAGSYIESEAEYEPRDALLKRYQSGNIPAVGFASNHFARRAKSKTRKNRAVSLAPGRQSSERYIPNSASDAYEAIFANKRAVSLAAANARDSENSAALAALESRRQRQRRAKSEMQFLDNIDVPASENSDRSKFRDHYTNEYVWVEKNHITDVGVKYDGIGRKIEHKPSHWRCEDEIERGKEYKRLNDECADKIADNRQSLAVSRDWLVNDGGIVDRIHRMNAKALKTRYDLDSIRRNMDNIRSMRSRLLKN